MIKARLVFMEGKTSIMINNYNDRLNVIRYYVYFIKLITDFTEKRKPDLY